MYVIHSHSRLTPFYAVFIEQQQWQLNHKNSRHIARICREYVPDFQLPENPDLATVDRYVSQYLSESLINLVVSELYQTFLLEKVLAILVNIVVFKLAKKSSLKKSIVPDISQQIWINFIHYINRARLVPRLWNQLPAYKRTNEKLELFQNSALLSPVKLFTNFNPEYDSAFLSGIERWTYRSLRNISYARIRHRNEPLFGLKDLGVVAKLTPSYIRNTRLIYVSKEQLISDRLLVQIFKNYLKRSDTRTNKLKPDDWEEIHREVEKQWHKLKLDSPPPSIEQIQKELDSIGDCVRKASDMKPIDSLDRVLNSNNSEQTLGDTNIETGNIDLEDRESLHKGCKQLLPVITAAIDKLSPDDGAILKMHYQEGLTQQEIGKKLGEDQSSISRTLRAVHQHLLKVTHQQIDNPNNSGSKVNQASIAAMKQLLKIFYQN